jgi:hypothetical protein
MPKNTGSPVTISNGQPQREVTHYNTTVFYDTAGVRTFAFNAFGRTRLRAADGSVLYESDQFQFLSLADAGIPAQFKTNFGNIVDRLDLV